MVQFKFALLESKRHCRQGQYNWQCANSTFSNRATQARTWEFKDEICY